MMFNMIYPFACMFSDFLHRQGKCITIFSAPNYCDSTGNKGAVIRFDHDLKPIFDTVFYIVLIVLLLLVGVKEENNNKNRKHLWKTLITPPAFSLRQPIGQNLYY